MKILRQRYNIMYSTWQVAELKAELKKRGASVRGKKADLVERLEQYDKHFNFGRPECVDNEDSMKVPPNETYKDVNSNTILPTITRTQIRHYLDCTEKKMKAAVELYESRHLITLRASVIGSDTFIKGFCRKTMKKLQYEVDIKLDKFGNPIETHCECPAGSGLNAVCKHVAVLLLGVEHISKENFLLKYEVCTEKLQQFHVPKKLYTGTPVRAEKLPKRRGSINVLFEPYHIKNLNKENYNSRVRSLVLNFGNTTMPMKQLYEPANPYGIQMDHNYTGRNVEDDILKDLKILNVTKTDIEQIEQMTREQSSSFEWHHHRQHRITASNFHTICHLKTTTMEKYAQQIMYKEGFQSRATKHGVLNEKIALNQYCVMYDLEVEPCGLFISEERPYLGASPDGLLGSETVIEIKCPYASRYQDIRPTTVPYLVEIDNILTLKHSTPYYYQIQGQMYCTGRSYCNLVIYTYKEMKVVYVSRDNHFIKEMLNKLDNFYEKYFKQEVLRKYLYYDYHKMNK